MYILRMHDWPAREGNFANIAYVYSVQRTSELSYNICDVPV